MEELSTAARRYSRENAERFRLELHEMMRIPSRSGDPAHAGDIRRMAEGLDEHMRSLGLDNVAMMHTAGHPGV